MGIIRVGDFTDEELYAKCQEYGANAKEWLRKFAGLLPEVYRRHLYKRKGFVSIHEFAKKLAGMNERTVDKVINLAHKLHDKPKLLALLENGEAGWSKIEEVAYVADHKTDEEWAEKVTVLNQTLLRVAVKEKRKNFTVNGQGEHKSKILQDWGRLGFAIRPDVEQRFRAYKFACEKKFKRRLSWNEALDSLLKAKELPQEVINLELCPDCVSKKGLEAETRHIPKDVQRIVIAKYNGRCAVKGCNFPYCAFHHIVRIAEGGTHHPENLVILCKLHHDAVHMGMIENEKEPPHIWRLRRRPMPSDVDWQVQKHKPT